MNRENQFQVIKSLNIERTDMYYGSLTETFNINPTPETTISIFPDGKIIYNADLNSKDHHWDEVDIEAARNYLVKYHKFKNFK